MIAELIVVLRQTAFTSSSRPFLYSSILCTGVRVANLDLIATRKSIIYVSVYIANVCLTVCRFIPRISKKGLKIMLSNRTTLLRMIKKYVDGKFFENTLRKNAIISNPRWLFWFIDGDVFLMLSRKPKKRGKLHY